MKRFFLSLVSGDERGVSSPIVCGIWSLLVFSAITAFAVIHNPDIWTPIAWAAFAGACASIIAIISGAQTAHSRWSSGAQTATVSSPGEVAHVETKP